MRAELWGLQVCWAHTAVGALGCAAAWAEEDDCSCINTFIALPPPPPPSPPHHPTTRSPSSVTPALRDNPPPLFPNPDAHTRIDGSASSVLLSAT